MRLRDLRDVYSGQEIYIVGSGPTTNIFPMDFLSDKICMALNDSFKIHPNVHPIALMHHEIYSRAGNSVANSIHPNFYGIKFPVVKATGRLRQEVIDWDDPFFYFYDWNHQIENIFELNKNSDELYYTPEGCSLHAAMQLAWIMGAKTIYTIGCDCTTFSGYHYARYDKNGFRDDETLKRGLKRNYDSYVKGALIVREFLRRKGVSVFNLSPIIGYHMVEDQYNLINSTHGIEGLIAEFATEKTGVT